MLTMNSAKILHAVRSAITAIAELLVKKLLVHKNKHKTVLRPFVP